MKLSDWPALSHLPSYPVSKLAFERAIWGKVEGARTDFRWIGRSAGFRGHLHGVERALTVSSEDQPRTAPLWLRWEGSYYAVSCYPSRARDATGRPGLLEKQIAEWRSDGIPPALGALVLLPHVAIFTDESWMGTARDPRWWDPGFMLELERSECAITREKVFSTISEGLHRLRNIADPVLEEFYAEVIEGRRPALLASGDEPLTPEALGVLMLPFRDEIASDLSLAGWIPSDRADMDELRNWSGVAYSSKTQVRRNVAPDSTKETRDLGRQLVQALRQPETRFASMRHPFVSRILEFARGPERWLDAADLPDPGPVGDFDVTLLREAIRHVLDRAEGRSDLPEGTDEEVLDARRRQLQVKAEVVRAAFMLVCPDEFQTPHLSAWLRLILDSWLKDSQHRRSSELYRRIQSVLADKQNPSLRT